MPRVNMLLLVVVLLLDALFRSSSALASQYRIDVTRTLDARTTGGATRPICAYPLVALWTRRGDSADGCTYRCVPATRMELRPA